MAREILQSQPSQPRGAQTYSNAGYIVAGAMLEHVTGKSWEELMKEYLFGPLEMTSCGFGPAATPPDRVDASWGHRLVDHVPTPIPPGPKADNPPAFGPAGTVHCSVSDWAKFVRAHFGPSELLTERSLATMHEVQDELSGHALGWIVRRRAWGGNGAVLTHSGYNMLNYAVVWSGPQRDLGVIVVTNIYYEGLKGEIDVIVSDLIKEFF